MRILKLQLREPILVNLIQRDRETETERGREVKVGRKDMRQFTEQKTVMIPHLKNQVNIQN